MGQAFRRASGKLRTTSIDTPSQYQKPFDKKPPIVPTNDKVRSQNKDSVTGFVILIHTHFIFCSEFFWDDLEFLLINVNGGIGMK